MYPIHFFNKKLVHKESFICQIVTINEFNIHSLKNKK